MSMLQPPPAAAPRPEKLLLGRLLSSFNAANGLLLSIFLIEGLWIYLWMEWLGNWGGHEVGRGAADAAQHPPYIVGQL